MKASWCPSSTLMGTRRLLWILKGGMTGSSRTESPPCPKHYRFRKDLPQRTQGRLTSLAIIAYLNQFSRHHLPFKPIRPPALPKALRPHV